MKIEELKSYMKNHWSFRLFNLFPSVNYIPLAFLIALGIYLMGLIIFTIAGESGTYISSLYPYLSSFGFVLVIISYGWWRNELAKMLAAVCPALEVSSEGFTNLIQQWDRKWINSLWSAIVFSIPLSILNFREVIALWSNGIPEELHGWFSYHAWGIWISSPHSVLFGIWYGFLHAILESFVLGSGVAGVIATIMLIRAINNQELKLAYYRRLDVVVELGANLAFWVLIALGAISLFTRPAILTITDNFQLTVASVESKDMILLIATTVTQIILALLTLIVIFGLPFFICHETIKKAKAVYVTNLLVMAEKLYSEIRRVSQSSPGNELNLETEKLEKIHKQLSVINSLIQEIDKISTWPGTLLTGIQVFGGFLLSIFTPVATDWLTQAVTG